MSTASSNWVESNSKNSSNTSQPKSWMQVPGDWRRQYDERVYPIVWDDELGYGRLWPRPTAEEIGASYQLEAYYTHAWQQPGDPTQQSESGIHRWLVAWAWRFDRSIYISADWLRQYQLEGNLDILDIGAGNGRLIDQLRGAGHTVTGIEPDPDARKIATEKQLDIYPGTAENYPAEIQDKRYDVIFMIHVLEHCVDPDKAVQNAVNLLKPNGVLVIETPNNGALGAKMAGRCWRWLDVPRHLNFFTQAGLENLISRSGVVLENREFRGYSRQFKQEWVSNEQMIWQLFSDRLGGAISPYPSARRAFMLLIRSFWRRPELKYDSVRVIARRK